MCISLLGTKVGMTQIFNTSGLCIPVTIMQVGPCIITLIKTIESDGYNAVQLGYKQISSHLLTNAQFGHLNHKGLPSLKYLYETKTDSPKSFKIGQIITATNFKIGEFINVSGLTIGRGFSGYQKKHHFSRGPMSHGCKNHRKPGSIGAGTTPGRVFPGKKMAGRLGNNNTTIRNLQILDIDTNKDLVIIKGAVPGKVGNIVKIHPTLTLRS
jgi:large subunit ribosomal protein L3|uniref:Large ribosomal subunit protein uL3c n=1 Tax=Thorea hispida TaxID=202687 RepID=A0A1C9CAT8_9FLOR|nr:ribosomal protein L3 [Thorea hispida]AOM65485.1 ribosomal protein L3 [Thorea hispida]ARX95854.1 50S ribosomal protein L3 [Thorea hispida]UNJ79139.1 ribosomal protein L3 [Thorea hispida]